MSTPILTVRNMHKSFGNTYVLKGVDFSVEKGEVFSSWFCGCPKSAQDAKPRQNETDNTTAKSR